MLALESVCETAIRIIEKNLRSTNYIIHKFSKTKFQHFKKQCKQVSDNYMENIKTTVAGIS